MVAEITITNLKHAVKHTPPQIILGIRTPTAGLKEEGCENICKIHRTLKTMVLSLGRKAMATPGIFPLENRSIVELVSSEKASYCCSNIQAPQALRTHETEFTTTNASQASTPHKAQVPKR